MPHALKYSGAFETNYPKLAPGSKTFTGSDGKEHPSDQWPSEATGIRVSYMEKPGKHFVAVRVQDSKSDIVLKKPVLLEPSRHMGYGKRFSAEPSVIEDKAALELLADILKQNPDLRDELKAIRDRMNEG
jgi:hypothetical protein